MIPYMLLIAIPAVFTFVAVDRTKSPTRLLVGSNNHEAIHKNNWALPVFFVLLFLLLALRHETVGRDLVGYKLRFEVFSQQSTDTFNLLRFESLYRLLNWAVGQFTDSFQVFLAVIAAITVVPIALLYCEDRRRGFMKIVLFVSMATFVMMFSGIRQMIAVSLGIVAYFCVRKKKLLLFLLVTIVALGFHHSAFMIFMMYPLYHIRLKKNHLWFIIPIVVAVFLFNSQIFGVLNTLLAQYEESYEAVQIVSTGAYTSLILFVAFAVFTYVIPDESKMDDEMYGLRNFLMLTVALQCFAPLHTLAMRMNYYYIIFIPITVAKFMDIPQQAFKRVAKVAAVVITAYFLWDFVSTIYSGYVTGISALDTVPYIPFWG